VARQVEDRVADELPGGVVGGLAAAVDLDDGDVCAVGDVNLPGLGPPPERDRRWMLEEQDGVGRGAFRDARRQRAL
jgi:hypothetical protein